VLSDYERKTLREVEQRLMAEDPEFARAFAARQMRLSRHPRRLGARIALVAAALFTALMLVTGSLVGALAFAVATGLLWVAWRHPADTERQAPPLRE
jgi:Flp pilus assembly protein TadB